MTNLHALVGSRICHDLINPLGAIGNGIELLGLTGVGAGPEFQLVEDSVANATAKLKLLRLAFGAASREQVCSRIEILSILDAVAHGGRLRYSWHVSGDVARLDARVALLAAMCVESALPMGGEIDLRKSGEHWEVQTQNDRLTLDPNLWGPLGRNACPDDLSAAQVHFGLLAPMAEEAGRKPQVSHGANWVKIAF
ncbi:histidine phosphotransferase family protein [Thalassorhabdomicrobium marinisediminis]|uniref:histidine phosphotransferase family protein n=1 Tax=Thalassorhabdomicrobium marinisediminis TaxID=2170577 RepID=UPI001F546734|nr:histidine phosphotransferase family protein [Thalassorhabdomicrobium marinisediminis]